ncbi:hypothetical protein W97_02015 [Coniosporium apollinis CBS 100218]|uniref:FCP1 homology domain-containing protein n=1 Tax=Coniosporium apollinis (strain CBS 100218) TaxID=1168221 RepID=R7YLK5_CONA1|nr:uncharacterized protein W97_02015 [Coniosporium apollinis CBS 100218]EON62790.1 hypothetical protein W97_02015 [Coniosporium apollinis CBS 100218]
MNSLNILSAIGATPPPSPSRSRSASRNDIFDEKSQPDKSEDVEVADPEASKEQDSMAVAEKEGDGTTDSSTAPADEKTPLLSQEKPGRFGDTRGTTAWTIPKRIAGFVVGACRVVLSALVAPGRYVIACFYDDEGHFSAILPIRMAFGHRRRKTSVAVLDVAAVDRADRAGERRSRSGSESRARTRKSGQRSASVASDSTAMSSESEGEQPPARVPEKDSPSQHTRSRSVPSAEEEIAPAKRSIRIKLHSDDALKQRRRLARTKTVAPKSAPTEEATAETAAALKSPTSPASVASSRHKFPRAPAPPRPLVPRRMNSYTASPLSMGTSQKTLIIDLDETLIHSMAKGGRFTTGHMVEVKLPQTMGPGGIMLPPQHILYYVHKRPHCEEFLKKVSKWYNLIVFTASVQEYADPVIDWLELERKYFSARYYRQHCTYRSGAYIKDLSQVEPDLSKVMILDNSPMSYIFHEDNAIPIEGWISDPTDNDLLHLIPFLEGLQYVTDVRALLALRLGQPATV